MGSAALGCEESFEIKMDQSHIKQITQVVFSMVFFQGI